MRKYYFYHIPGIKVGCTVLFEQRSSQYRKKGYEGPIILLETREFASDKEAGDYERYLAEQYDLLDGVGKSTHYINNWSSRLTPEDRFRVSQAGGLKAGILGKSGFHQMTTEQRSEYGRRGALVTANRDTNPFKTGEAQRKSAKSPNHINNRVLTCPTCGKVGKGANMYKSHFSRCKSA